MGTIPASENVFPVVRIAEAAAPGTPPTGEAHLYVKSDGLLYWKDDAGTEYPAGGSIADIIDIPTAETDDTLVLAPDGAGGVEFRAEAGGGSVTAAEAFLSGNVTMSSTNTWYDGPSLSLAAGSYVVMGSVVVRVTGSGAFLTARLWDGTNIFHAPDHYMLTDTGEISISVFAYITLGSTTTVKISAARNAGNTDSNIKATAVANGTTDKASKIVALKIA